ncbi:hypothetical protein CVT26_006387 [Gymnopilus dilepis]|uniref:Uncharacterized protein n=1 Tax=Gymnopilus dilepis TaxID=231916 RepID=A0A409Y0I1_9AGAR|nr:hypothetical protein CVT26_006387 [Gymnopilus dilepis]
MSKNYAGAKVELNKIAATMAAGSMEPRETRTSSLGSFPQRQSPVSQSSLVQVAPEASQLRDIKRAPHYVVSLYLFSICNFTMDKFWLESQRHVQKQRLWRAS